VSSRDGAARLSLATLCTLWSCDLDLWAFGLVIIVGPARYRDGLSLCQVWRFWFKLFWFHRADRHTDRITDADDRYTDAIKRFCQFIIFLIKQLHTSSHLAQSSLTCLLVNTLIIKQGAVMLDFVNEAPESEWHCIDQCICILFARVYNCTQPLLMDFLWWWNTVW